MSGNTSQTQSTSTLFNFFNIFDKLKFKKKSKCKTSGLLEKTPENIETDTKNENNLCSDNDNGNLRKSDNKKGFKTNKDNYDNVLKDKFITKIENYADIEKPIANNSIKEEGQIVSEILPNKTFEKASKISDSECIVLHQKKYKSKKKEKIDNEESSLKEEQVNESNEHNENLDKEPASNICSLDNSNNNHNNDNNKSSHLFRDYNDVNTEKSEMKKRKENKRLKCEYIVENCNVVELNKDVINQLKTLPVNFNERQMLFMEGKHIKKVLDHNRPLSKKSNTLKLKKCKASYSEKPLNSKRTNSQCKFARAIRNENTTFNISKSLIITESGVENQKIHQQDLPSYSVDNVNTITEMVSSKKKKRRKTANTYHELTKPKSNLIIVENNMDDKTTLKSNENGLVSESAKEKHIKETPYLDSIPVRDSKDSSIDQCNVESEKNSSIILPRNDINNKFLNKHFYNNHPDVRKVLGKQFYNKHDVHTDKVTHEQRMCQIKERTTDTAEQESVGIEVRFDDKPNELYNFLIKSKFCGSSTKHEMANEDFPHDSIRNKLNALKTTTLKTKIKQFQEESRHSSNLPHTLKTHNECNRDAFKKIKSKSFNKPTLKSSHADYVCKQKRLPYTLVKRSFIPDMEHKEYISVANIRAQLKLKNGTLNEVSIQPETKFKTSNGQHTDETKTNSSSKQNRLEENNHRKFNNLHYHANFHGDCFVDKNMQTNEEGLKFRFNNNIENMEKLEKGDCVPDESEILVNQFNMFLKIMKNLKAGNSESMENIIKDRDFLSKCLKLVNLENHSTYSQDKFVRVIESTEIENWKNYISESVQSNTKHVDSLPNNSLPLKRVNAVDHNEPNREYFVRIVESSDIKNMNSEPESSPIDTASVPKLYKFLNHKHNRVLNRNNFVRIIKSSEHCNTNNKENGNKHSSDDLLISSCSKNNNTGISVSSREKILVDLCHNKNKTSSIQSHPRLSVNFVNTSKNRSSGDAADDLCHIEENKPWAVKYGELRTLSENGILNRKVYNEKVSHNNNNFPHLNYKHRDNFILTDFTSIKRNTNSCENKLSYTTNNSLNCYQPKACYEEIEDTLTNRNFGKLYSVKPGDSPENEHKSNIITQIKFNSLCRNLRDFSSQQNDKCIQNFSSVRIKNLFKSLSESNLSNRTLSTEKIILEDSDYSGPVFYKTNYKKQHKIISKDMGINTDVYTTDSEYLFNKCISLLSEHLIKMYELHDKNIYTGIESGNESYCHNVNFKKKESSSGYNLCRDNDSGSVTLPYTQHYSNECHKASEELYNLLQLILTNSLNVSELSVRKKACLNYLKDVFCQDVEKKLEKMDNSIAELSKMVNEVVKKHSNESVRAVNLNNGMNVTKHNELKHQPDRSGVEVEHKTSEILELMKIIENSDVSTSGCTDLSFIENRKCKRNCEISTNKNSMETKNVMHFQIKMQFNDAMQVDNVVIEGS